MNEYFIKFIQLRVAEVSCHALMSHVIRLSTML